MALPRINLKYKKILITGGCGFIGSHLIRRLLKYKNLSIVNIDNLNYASDIFFNQDLIKNNHQYTHLKIDISNSEKIQYVVKDIKPDIIFHLAAETHVDRSLCNPSLFVETNVKGTFNLLEATRSLFENMSSNKKKLFRFMHISTDEVFGSLHQKGKFNESSPLIPNSPYSASKAASDHFVNAWWKSYGIPTVITNCSNNFGPYQFPEKLIPLTILKCLSSEEIPLFGDGSNIRDWLFVEDHIEALILLSEHGKIGEKYCIGGDSEKSNKEVVTYICSLMDKYKKRDFPHKELIKNVTDRPGHDWRYAIDSSKLNNELNWKAKHFFEEALEKTVFWYLQNINWCKNILKKSGYESQRLGL